MYTDAAGTYRSFASATVTVRKSKEGGKREKKREEWMADHPTLPPSLFPRSLDGGEIPRRNRSIARRNQTERRRGGRAREFYSLRLFNEFRRETAASRGNGKLGGGRISRASLSVLGRRLCRRRVTPRYPSLCKIFQCTISVMTVSERERKIFFLLNYCR